MDAGETSANTDTVPFAQTNQGKPKRATHSKVSSTFNMKIFKLEKNSALQVRSQDIVL